MTLRLRAHHLLCLLTYVGRGYTPDFVANYDRIAARLAQGEDIVLVDGPDDICAPLLNGPSPHCHGDSVRARDRRAAADTGHLLGQRLDTGTRITLDAARLAALRQGFADGRLRAACAGCAWTDLCNVVSAKGYAQTRVHLAPAGPHPR
ncbi:DUF1284 domain-containing protein [Falsirhodobacter halotolerans]|uniref:DUF1284 domain-containing protein n=1 Tax=Falsirhodobacter halotolerans TaxID=1146892 RepID=UPI001FD044BD|nr:DUF1284 domain-containing protein [Falsirhodobacter halotolerans]MCJ8140692.1 DUF1284 domain-containing protein [Falsirhodobacter halotolerans]